MPALDEFLNAQAQAQVDAVRVPRSSGRRAGRQVRSGRVGVALNGFYTKLKNITGQGAVIDPVTGATTWRITVDPESRSYGAEVEASSTPLEGLQLIGQRHLHEAEQGEGIDSLVGERLALAPTAIGNLAALFSPRAAPGLQLKADWHYVGERFVEAPRDRVVDTKLPEYSYFNFGVGYAFPSAGVRLNVDLLNAFQSKGLEEGNPRLVASGGSPIFFARPILPRRLQASIDYDFGGGR